MLMQTAHPVERPAADLQPHSECCLSAQLVSRCKKTRVRTVQNKLVLAASLALVGAARADFK